jgi:hypothetical protein
VLEACEDGSVRGSAALAGLPIFSEDGAAPGALCANVDAKAVFEGMMKYEIPMLVAPGAQGSSNANSIARLSNFELRPDLFRRIYDDGSTVVYAPAFSEYSVPAQ